MVEHALYALSGIVRAHWTEVRSYVLHLMFKLNVSVACLGNSGVCVCVTSQQPSPPR